MIRIINHVTTRKYSTANLRKEAQFLTLSDFLDCADSVLDTDWTVNVRRTLNSKGNRMFIGPCIIVIVEELETNLMSLIMFITLNICSTCFEH